MEGRKMRVYDKRILMFLVPVLIVTLLTTFGIPAARSSSTLIYVNPSTVTVLPSEDFNVNVEVENVTGLLGWQVILRWDPKLLNYVQATEGDFLTTGGATTWLQPSGNQSEGWVCIADWLNNVGSGVSGSGKLADVTFHSVASGECVLSLDKTRLLSSTSVSVTVPPLFGDIDGDGKVDQRDVGYVARAFLTQSGDPRWNPNADFNKDDFIDLFDVLCVAWHFGQSITLPAPPTLTQVTEPLDMDHEAQNGYVLVSNAPIIQVLPKDLTVEIGEHFNVSANILEVHNFSSLQYRLSWNPDVLQAVNLYEGNLMPGRGKSFFAYRVYEEQGYALISNTFLGPTTPVAIVDNGSLLTMEFSAVHAGPCLLNVSDTAYAQEGANVTVQPASNVTAIATDYLGRSPVKQSNSVLTVGTSGQQYQTIQDAVDNADPGDIIHVFSGTYNENVIINTGNLTLIGENRTDTIIKAATNTPGTSVIEVRDVNDTKIMEFTIQDGDAGVKALYYCNKTTVKDNVIENNSVGVSWVGWQTSLTEINETLLGNNVTNNNCGLCVWNTEGDTIRADNITDNQIGIQKVANFANSVICLNNIVNNVPNQLIPTTIDSTNNIQWYCTAKNSKGTTVNKGNYWNPPDPDTNDPYPLPNFWIPIRGDVNLDGVVAMLDISLAAVGFGAGWSNYRWNPQVDINKDGVINILDIASVARNYDKLDP
jgi:nitrous oxidase accessory protein NosD